MSDVILDTVIDTAKLVPFLFLTYWVMEYLEHRTGAKTRKMVQKAGKWGPMIGSVLGAVPQCGFSAAASNLYAGRVITLGTLISIYLSTSDEMLPIMLSKQADARLIVSVLFMKVLIGMVAGFVIDWCYRGKQPEEGHIHDLCEHEHCHCEEGILHSAVHHTLHISFFILLISFALNLVLYFMGEDALSAILLNHSVFGPVLAGLVGLIPNCAASVAITQLFLEGVIGIGSMMAGLLVGAGVGLLVLFRMNHHRKENFRIVGLLYAIGVVTGIVLELLV